MARVKSQIRNTLFIIFFPLCAAEQDPLFGSIQDRCITQQPKPNGGCKSCWVKSKAKCHECCCEGDVPGTSCCPKGPIPKPLCWCYTVGCLGIVGGVCFSCYMIRRNGWPRDDDDKGN